MNIATGLNFERRLGRYPPALVLSMGYEDSRRPIIRFFCIQTQFFFDPSCSSPACQPIMSYLFPSPPTFRIHTNIPPYLFAFCLHRSPSWVCVRLGEFPLPPQSHPFPPCCLLSLLVLKFCLSSPQRLSPMLP